MAERAVTTQLELARGLGADLHTTERVVDVTTDERDVVVTTDRDSYRANHVVIAAGPWMRELVQQVHRRQLEVTRQLVLWFEPEDPAVFSIERFPFLMWVGDSIADYFAVFPIAPGGTPAVKVLDEQFSDGTEPDTVDRTVSQTEIDSFYERHLASSINGLTRNCVRAEVCLYTTTPDEHFLIDADPRSDRITVMSPCSGHGFKHSTALGEAVAEQVATGSSTLNLEPFRSRL